MAKELHALIVEDVERDAALLVRELRQGGFDLTFERVDSAESMTAALSRKHWDVVISDYALPGFSAAAALSLIQARRLDLPFIIVSGTVNEELAVEVIRAGAHDFMAKGNFVRLIPAIERELREATRRSQRAAMEEQLLVSDRMASVGTLAAGVAHEINNPLAALMANLEFIAEDVNRVAQELSAARGEEGAAAAEGSAASLTRAVSQLVSLEVPLRDAAECAERVRLIVRDLRLFSRSDDEARGPVDLHRVLDSSIRMAWNEIRHRARLVKDYGMIDAVEGNEARLGQVFLNLLVNAAQSIPEGAAEQNEIRVVTRMGSGGKIVVEVHDTGGGIDPAILGRVFDPFFTTKPPGVGSGLGLTICHRIVTAIGGEIAIRNAASRGTVVRAALLPAGAGQRQRSQPPRAGHEELRRGKVLVVDDEPALGSAVQRMLTRHHDVDVTTSGREAIRRVAEGERFDAILCDLMMPDRSGMDLHEELTRIAPEQASRMVFMTGGAFTGRAAEFLAHVPNLRLEKPFDTRTLRSAIDQVVAGKA